ncbi:MAG TPA: hypothetical protein VIU40_06840 [Geobacteraceae bacterium]
MIRNRGQMMVENKTERSFGGGRCRAGSHLLLIAVAVALLGGCAANQAAVSNGDYVEIENPFYEGNTTDSPTVWVPRSSVEKGVPRGKELVKKGYEAVTGTSDQPDAAPVVVTDAARPHPGGLRSRLLVAEVGSAGIAALLQGHLGRGCTVRLLSKPSAVVPSAEQEQMAYLRTLANQPGGGPALVLTATEGVRPGARLKADLYDIRGPILIRSFTVTIPPPAKDESPEEAVRRTLRGLADAVLGSLEWFTWYGRVVSVSGERVYIDAGAESGLKRGQKLLVYRGGEAVRGIGFAPGTHITTFTIVDLVGPDGAYGTSADAARVQPGDFVELEK